MRVSYRPRFPNGPPRDSRFLRVVGRMKAGMSIEGAEARMQALARGLEAEHPGTNAGWSIRLSPLADEIARHESSGAPPRLCGDLLPAVAGLRQCRQSRDRAWGRAREGIRDSTGARGAREPRQATVDRRKPVERDRHDGHRRLPHCVVGGRGRVNRAGRHSAHTRGGHQRTSRVVRRRTRAPGHRCRKRRSDLSRQPHTNCGRAQRRGCRFRKNGPAGCARDWWSPRLPPR